MFDCVLPTRNGRHGLAFTRFGSINLKNARHADDPRPLDEESPMRGGARLFARLSASSGEGQRDARAPCCCRTINLAYYQDLMAGVRDAIAAGRFDDFRDATREGWERGDLAPV